MSLFYDTRIFIEGRNDIVCEDTAHINSNFAFVLDGAGGVDGKHITPSVTDAKWFVEEWKEYLTDALYKDESIIDIVKQGVPVVAQRYESFSGAETVKDKPSAALCTVRLNQNRFEYFVLCDCVLIVRMKDGSCKLLTDTRLNVLDDINNRRLKDVAIQKGITVKEAFNHIIPYILENRYKANTPDGYAVLSHTTDQIETAVMGSIPAEDVCDFVAFSDGFAEAFDLFFIYKTVDELIDDISKNGIEQAVLKLHREHDKDPDCNNFVRNKKSDDISVVYAKISMEE